MSNSLKIQELQQQNSRLKKQLNEATAKNTELSNKIEADVNSFTASAKASLTSLNDALLKEQQEATRIHRELAIKYEGLLKQQIELLSQNKQLSASNKISEDKLTQLVEELSSIYEKKFAEIDAEIKTNVSKINELNGVGLIRKLSRSQKFRNAITNQGGDPDLILKHAEIQALVKGIQEKNQEIAMLEESNSKVDEEVAQMSETMADFKQVLEGMSLEKETLLKHKSLLLDKLQKSRELLMKFFPAKKQ